VFGRRHAALKTAKAAFQVGLEILDVLKSDGEAAPPVPPVPIGWRFDRPRSRTGSPGSRSRPRIAHAEQGQAVQQRIDGGLRLRFQHDAEQARGTAEIAFPDRVSGIGFERGMQHPDDLGAGPRASAPSPARKR